MARLGVVLSTSTAAPPKTFVQLGQLAEDHGFDAVLVNEGRGDALACAEAIAPLSRKISLLLEEITDMHENILDAKLRVEFWEKAVKDCEREVEGKS